jgi:hypothetical protein
MRFAFFLFALVGLGVGALGGLFDIIDFWHYALFGLGWGIGSYIGMWGLVGLMFLCMAV